MKTPFSREVDLAAINTIRFLAVDMVERAQSGHPGAPLGQAPLAYLVWTRHLRHDPADSAWPNRDRFVLSCGHASALLYGLLHLSGYDMPVAELERFRQLGSKTPGHPEYGLVPGAETTTGPLGQGLGNAVGMAVALRLLASRFNREDFPLFDHRVWVFASDGDLMEGVSAEASSFAGHQRLASLKVFYDSNRITIDGSTDLAFSEDVLGRYAAYGWRTLRVDDANDLDALESAIAAAASENERPTIVLVKTHIGYGSPKQDSEKAHGEPLGADAAKATKEKLGWPLAPEFLVPDAARAPFAAARERNAAQYRAWRELFLRYRAAHPEAAAELERRLAGELPSGWDSELPSFAPSEGPMATRQASGKVLAAISQKLPELVGGSADLTPSNNTQLPATTNFEPDTPGGRYFHFGVREHGMGAILNGMALSGALRPFGATFLIFSDFMRPAIRLGSLMQLPVVYVFTHDSIFLGEDGPTHQPISQLLSLRSLPGVVVLRPGDANETVEAWRIAIARRNGPTALALTRQKLPVLEEARSLAREGVAHGAYVLWQSGARRPRLILIATGSEVALALEAGKRLAGEGIAIRVVSMPSWELFEAQTEEYRRSVLPPDAKRRLAIEAACPIGWDRYFGPDGGILAMNGFGASGRHEDLARHFGFTVEEVIRRGKDLLG